MLLRSHGRRRLAQHLLQQEAAGWRPAGTTGAASGIGRGRCLATDTPGAPGAPAESGPADAAAGPLGASRGRGRGQRIASQLQELQRAGAASPGRRQQSPGMVGSQPQRARPPWQAPPPAWQQRLTRQQQDGRPEQQQRGPPRYNQQPSRGDGPQGGRQGFGGPPGREGFRQMGPREGGQGGGRFPQQQRYPRGGRPGRLQGGFPPGADGPPPDPEEDDLLGRADRGRRRLPLKGRRGPPGAEGFGEQQGLEGGPARENFVAPRRHGGPPRRSADGGGGGDLAAGGGRRRRQSDNWDVSGDDVELRPARGDKGGRKGWNFKFDSRADLAVRERVAANVDAILNSEGALNELRPGPWMLDAADDPVALPNEQAAQANTDHLLRMELDPEFDMAIGGAPPPRTPGPDLAPEETLQLLRPELCKTLGMAEGDEEGWQTITEGAVEEMQARLRQLNIRPARDHWAEIAELEALLDDLLPKDDVMYSRCARTVRELSANPSFSHEQRCALLRRQVKDLTSPLPPRLALRDMFATAQAAAQQ